MKNDTPLFAGTAKGPITVLVVEDNTLLREEFTAMVRATAGLELVGAAASLAAAREVLAQRMAPDVAIVDLGLPDGDGIDLIREWAQLHRTQCLVATIFDDEWHVVRALEAGARGYLLKDSTADEFAKAIRLVHEGAAPVSPQVARHLLKRFSAPAPAAPHHHVAAELPRAERLSMREAEILNLISKGYSVGEVARLLNLSPHTVGTHVRNIYDKLCVNNRLQAVNKARSMGQIP